MAADAPSTTFTFKAKTGEMVTETFVFFFLFSNQKSPEVASTYISLARTGSHGHPGRKEGWEVGDWIPWLAQANYDPSSGAAGSFSKKGEPRNWVDS